MQVSQLVAPVKEEFECLFHATFSVKQNAQFLASIQVCVGVCVCVCGGGGGGGGGGGAMYNTLRVQPLTTSRLTR